MGSSEKPIQDPENEWRGLIEQGYKESLKAVEWLHEMSLSGNGNEVEIQELLDVIGTYGSFQDHLVESEMGTYEGGQYTGAKYKISPYFFETLPVLNKMAMIYNNFSTRARDSGGYFLNAAIHHLSDDAHFVLARGFGEVSEDALNQLSAETVNDFFESLKIILTSDLDYAIEETVNFLNSNKELFIKLSRDKQFPDIQNQAEGLLNFLKTREFERVLVNAVQEGINNRRDRNQGKSKAKIEHCEDLLKNILIKYGFDPDDILEIWNGSYTEYAPQPQINRNMNRVFDLEDKRKGIASLLYKEFGIRNFERYPESILIAQFDEFKNVEKPYGVMIQATHDWNGGFGMWSNAQVWEKLFEQIKEHYAFRIIEAKSKMEVARRLIGLNRKYGEHHKLSFAFIGGHGSKKSITFGGPHIRNMLLSEDLTGHGVRRTGSFFEPNPTIVLVSCSTGAEGGIGQELSKALGAKVIAPSVPTSLKNIVAFITRKGIDFSIEYSTKEEEEDIRKVYLAGEEIEN